VEKECKRMKMEWVPVTRLTAAGEVYIVCVSGCACLIFRLVSLAQTMSARDIEESKENTPVQIASFHVGHASWTIRKQQTQIRWEELVLFDFHQMPDFDLHPVSARPTPPVHNQPNLPQTMQSLSPRHLR
jgi:hypothetical protein